MPEMLDRLQEWYAARCDGDWEEDSGIVIDTLDNPGWSLVVDLKKTPLDGLRCGPSKLERTEVDWLQFESDGAKFTAFGGPRNLVEMIASFLDWAAREGR